MPTNLNLDDTLLDEAVKLSGKRTKRDTVNAALAEFVSRRKQRRILELFGPAQPEGDVPVRFKRFQTVPGRSARRVARRLGSPRMSVGRLSDCARTERRLRE